MIRLPVVSSGEVKVKEASHLSNLPAMETEASTWNLIQLCTGVTRKTGACARLTESNKASGERHRIASHQPVLRHRRSLLWVMRSFVGQNVAGPREDRPADS